MVNVILSKCVIFILKPVFTVPCFKSNVVNKDVLLQWISTHIEHQNEVGMECQKLFAYGDKCCLNTITPLSTLLTKTLYP